jgi:Fe2+ transport system protein B
MGVAIITGFAAKEIIVSTLGILYQGGSAENDGRTLLNQLQSAHTNRAAGGPQGF